MKEKQEKKVGEINHMTDLASGGSSNRHRAHIISRGKLFRNNVRYSVLSIYYL